MSMDAKCEVVTICGSMRFENEIKRIAFILEAKHNMTVLQCVYNEDKLDILANRSRRRLRLPITVGNSVWIGTNVSVLPGVTIGSNTIIGADNPCKVIRKITDEDKKKYPIFEER